MIILDQLNDPRQSWELISEPLKGVLDFWGRSKRHTQLQLFVAFLFSFLVPDVLNDRRFIESDRGDKVAPCPKVFTREISLLSYKKPSDHHCALPFQIPNDIRYRLFWRYPQAQVNRIWPQMPFDNFHVFMTCSFVKPIAKHPSDLTIDYFLPPLGNENNRIFAIPF